MMALVVGDVKNCGCVRIESFRKRVRKHGRSHTLVYGVWLAMRKRCSVPTHPYYYIYGGRGIKVCERWEHSFEAFINDMGERPSSKHSIDRIDVNGDYEPRNCRWATAAEQTRNSRRNVRVSIDGETRVVEDWGKTSPVSAGAIRRRLAAGWDPTRAVVASNQSPRELSQQEIDSIRAKYAGGMSYNAIAKDVGIHGSTVWKICSDSPAAHRLRAKWQGRA
jgi:hypothetical protein